MTDFWRVGRGTATKLEKNGMFTLGDVAERSLYDEDELFKMFGVNAELLIDHAWGYEPATIADIKAYRPSANSISTGQVLSEPYSCDKARLIVKEMTDNLALDLTDKNLATSKITLTIGFDVESLTNPKIVSSYHGAVTTDHYGRSVPKPAHGTENLSHKTSSVRLLSDAAARLFDRIVDNKKLLVRRVTLCACDVTSKKAIADEFTGEQLDLFTDYSAREREIQDEKREESILLAVLKLKKKFGKNAVLKGMNFEDGATMRERNAQIGGHKA